MPGCELTHEAAADLDALFDYTIEQWGIKQAQSYKDKLLSHFLKIGRGEVNSRTFLKALPIFRFPVAGIITFSTWPRESRRR